MSLESIDDVESGDGLSLGVFGVGDGVLDNVLEELSEDNSGLVIDEGADSLDTTSSGESSDGWLGDTEDGVLDGLGGESLGSSLSADLTELSSFSFCWWHFIYLLIIITSLGSIPFKQMPNIRFWPFCILIGLFLKFRIIEKNP